MLLRESLLLLAIWAAKSIVLVGYEDDAGDDDEGRDFLDSVGAFVFGASGPVCELFCAKFVVVVFCKMV